MNENKTYSKTILLSFSFLIVFFKISISHILYPGEENFIKIVMDINSMQFISLIKSYSNFNFNPTFGLETINDFKNLAFPFMSTFFHSTLLSLMGLNSFYVIEFIGIFIFLLVFYKILNLLNFSKNNSVIITLLIFTIPNIAPEINFIFSKEFEMIVYNLKNLYNTRMPRPLVSNLYFYLYIFMIIKIYIKKSFSIKNAFYLALLSSISLHTFFYFSFIENFFLLVTAFAFYKKKIIYHILDNKKFYITYLIVNLISLFCLIIILKFVSIDNYKIIGLHEINLDQKIILIKTFFNYLSNKYFIINFLICLIFFVFIKKYEKNLQIFYYLYLGSILSFFTFILLYNKNIHYYYFQTFVIISSFIFIFFVYFKIF